MGFSIALSTSIDDLPPQEESGAAVLRCRPWLPPGCWLLQPACAAAADPFLPRSGHCSEPNTAAAVAFLGCEGIGLRAVLPAVDSELGLECLWCRCRRGSVQIRGLLLVGVLVGVIATSVGIARVDLPRLPDPTPHRKLPRH